MSLHFVVEVEEASKEWERSILGVGGGFVFGQEDSFGKGKHVAVLWPLTRIWRNTGICSGPGFSLESEGGISLVLCRWWLIPLVSRSSCGGRLLHGRVRCNPCGVAEEGWGEGMRVREGSVPDVMGAIVGAEASLFLSGDGQEISGAGKAHLEVGWACLLRRGEKLLGVSVSGSTSHSPLIEDLHDQCLSSPLTAMGFFKGLNPCVSNLTVLEVALKPLVDDAFLEKALKFQGTFSSSLSSWGEGATSSSTPFWVSAFVDLGGDCKGTVDLVKVWGGSPEREGGVLEIGVEVVKGSLSMVLHDGSKVVFPQNASLGEYLLFDKELSKFKEFSKFLGMSVEGGLRRMDCTVSYGDPTTASRRSGVNDWDKRKLIKLVVRSQKADLVYFLETKVQETLLKVVKSLDVGSFLDWGTVDARGASGGILIFWDNRVLDLLKLECRGFTNFGRFWNVEDGGDFNSVRFLRERRNEFNLTVEMRRCFEVIEGLRLKDLPLSDGQFMWCGGFNSQVASRDQGWVRRAYQTLLMENGDWRPHFGGLRFGVLREERSRSLEVPSSKEVFEALCNLSGDKALGRMESFEDVVSIMVCRVGKLPTSYLGLPLGVSFKSSKEFFVGLVALNKALLGKWSWRFVVERDSFWKQVIIDKFGVDEGGWCSRGVRGGYGVGVWKAIRKEWEGSVLEQNFDHRSAQKEGMEHAEQWVLHSSIKRNLLSWHGAFVGKRREKAWRAAP
ncbi:hypothetical protein CK203_037030 [Vitis vinifera]|uniref:Uncharacterized protein n=1 Tax=Vitis vinifera TaxID=29760 RepID=A0A438IUY1_VITVI|nr:hypothetical protein CK203_037030 [Vitis vinifera]